MPKPRLLITRKLPEAVEARAETLFDVTRNRDDRPLGREGLRAAFGEYDALLVTVTDPLDADMFAGKARVKILANYGVGFSHIDTDAARAAGITVTNTPDVLSECTADLAMTLLLMVARRTGEGERELRAGQWTGWRPTHLVGTSPRGKTLGIIGYGRIGQAMARLARDGFGMDIVVQSRSNVAQAVLDRVGATQVDTVEALLPRCDFVSLHCPGGAANRHLLDGARLGLLKPSAIVVNTARGEVIDEAALAEALLAGRLAGAGLDVFEQEPQVHPDLLRCENAVLLPHLGSATKETREGMGMRALDNLAAFFDGATPGDRVV